MVVVSYNHCNPGGPTWVRTRDLPVMSRWLFQLSYGPMNNFKIPVSLPFVKHAPRPLHSPFHERPKLFGTGRVTKFPQGLRFNLTDAFASYVEILSDFF